MLFNNLYNFITIKLEYFTLRQLPNFNFALNPFYHALRDHLNVLALLKLLTIDAQMLMLIFNTNKITSLFFLSLPIFKKVFFLPLHVFFDFFCH
jgi:hypothetical protein